MDALATQVAVATGVPTYMEAECLCCEGWGHHSDECEPDSGRTACIPCDATGVTWLRFVGPPAAQAAEVTASSTRTETTNAAPS